MTRIAEKDKRPAQTKVVMLFDTFLERGAAPVRDGCREKRECGEDRTSK